MVDTSDDSTPGCTLMDLPDEMIDTIITQLNKDEKHGFMKACRRGALLTMSRANMTLKVTRDTKFAGIRKVLDSYPANIHLEIINPTPAPSHDAEPEPLFALSYLIGRVPCEVLTQVASNCRWESITRATIQGISMRCLVPQLLSTSCPQLTRLKIFTPDHDLSGASTDWQAFTDEPADSLPLTMCISLTHLELDAYHDTNLQLPPAYHSPAELRENLPNIDTLIMSTGSSDLIEAFAAQLTRLEAGDVSPEAHPAIRQAANLVHLRVDEFVLPDNPAMLESFKITGVVKDAQYGKLLQCPRLSTVHMFSASLDEDWSSHACYWQELLLYGVEVVSLPHLSLRNVGKLSLQSAAIVYLPHWGRPDCLDTVQRAMTNLSHLGKIEVIQNARDVYLGRVTWFIAPFAQDDEQTVAEMLTTAAQLLGVNAGSSPLGHLQHSPVVLRAFVSWGRACLESVDLINSHHLQPHVWQALQQLQKLHEVVLQPHFEDDDAVADRHTMSQRIAIAVNDAAQHYVIPTGRSLCILGLLHDSYALKQDEDVGDEMLFLRTAIQNALPPGSQLASIGFQRAHPTALEVGYKHSWNIVIAPV